VQLAIRINFDHAVARALSAAIDTENSHVRKVYRG
jgi:hypothetical protein